MVLRFSNLLYEIRRICAVTVRKSEPQISEVMVRKWELSYGNRYNFATYCSEIVKFFRNCSIT